MSRPATVLPGFEPCAVCAGPDGCCVGRVGCVGCGVWSACQHVAENGPTVLPLAQRASRNPSAPLDNHEIAFGGGRIARRSSARRPLGFGAVLRHGWHGRASGAGRRCARGPCDSSGLCPRHASAGDGAERLVGIPPVASASASAAPGASSRPRALPLASAPPRPLRAGGTVAFPAARVPRALRWQ